MTEKPRVRIYPTKQKDCDLCNSEMDEPIVIVGPDNSALVICESCNKIICRYESFIVGQP